MTVVWFQVQQITLFLKALVLATDLPEKDLVKLNDTVDGARVHIDFGG
jgi:hypothetical protein